MRKLIISLTLFLLLFSFQNNSYASGNKIEKDSKLPQELIVRNKIKETLDALINAYTSKNLGVFMSLIAEDFTMDKSIFEDKIRRDFRLYHNIAIRYSINNITFNDSKKMAYVSLNFTIRYDKIRTNKSFKKDSTTELIFKDVDGQFKLYIMKKPFMFGISKKY